MFKKSVFIFHRDLRLEDNIGLIASLRNSEEVNPCFIYDPNFSNNPEITLRLNFLNESLIDLDNSLRKKKSFLQIFEGDSDKIIQKLINKNKIDAVFTNKDFSNYSHTRNEKIFQICKKNKIYFSSSLDFLLHNPNQIKTNNETPYSIYSQFYKKAKQSPTQKSLKNSYNNYSKIKISDSMIKQPSKSNPFAKGGRREGLRILKNLKNFQDYEKNRNFPYLDYTTKLSAHNKFGTISIREVFESIKENLGPNHSLINQIYWREFFSHILFHYPWAQKKSFRKRFQNIPWLKSKKNMDIWANGKTGFPIVDAGMRELNQTGFMHNRVRMITASFLTKDLHIDWRWGERYFAKKLIDYDPAINSGNWQWAASTGCDAVPYFRIFNPWVQQKKFDPKCQYIKKWIQELKDTPNNIIHNLWKFHPPELDYPNPIVNHNLETQKTKEIFKNSI